MSDRKRLNVHLYVTPVCNLQCKHCYYDAWRSNDVPENLLTVSEMKFIIMHLCDNYDAAFDVEGGEFFLRKDISTLFKVVPPSYLGKITITTNGTVKIITDYKYLQYLDEFRVSVEGHTNALQKEIRGINLTPILRTCDKLRSKGVPITLRITLHKKNYNYILDMLDYFASLGFTRFSLYEFQAAGRGRTVANEYCLEERQLEQVLTLLTSNSINPAIEVIKLSLSSARVKLVNLHRTELVSAEYEIIDISGIPSLTIDYNGNLGICPWNVGNDTIGFFSKKSFGSDIAKYIRTGRLNHICKYCSAVRVIYKPVRQFNY